MFYEEWFHCIDASDGEDGHCGACGERVVMVEDCGDSMRLVATDTGESFMCSESVEDVVRAIDGALS